MACDGTQDEYNHQHPQTSSSKNERRRKKLRKCMMWVVVVLGVSILLFVDDSAVALLVGHGHGCWVERVADNCRGEIPFIYSRVAEINK